MRKTSSVKKDFVAPIAVLTIICLVLATLLAFTNNMTAPIIEDMKAERAEAARLEVLPDAGNDGFEAVEVSGLPEAVTDVYKALNGSGFVFMLTSNGYGGADTMNLICGIGADGYLTAVKTLSHKETAGLGSKTTEQWYTDQYVGEDATLAGVSVISGSTISSNYYMNAIRDAFAAYELVKEVK